MSSNHPNHPNHQYAQVDVFSAVPLRGNPVAVVFDAAGLGDARMQDFARWTNLSETTFLLPPRDPAADYRLRIFTPGGELPFAGHPTLGSCHAWLEAGGVPRGDEVVQECGVGLVRIRREPAAAGAAVGRLAFAAPPLRRSGPADDATRAQIARALRVAPSALRAVEWVDNGPGWVAALLADADAVLALQPDFVAMAPLSLGVIGAYPAGADCAFEVRAFVPTLGVPEDPVTGSLNAGLAQWLIGAGLAPERYVASQGKRLGRAGRVHVQRRGDDLWIGGDSVTCIAGSLSLLHRFVFDSSAPFGLSLSKPGASPSFDGLRLIGKRAQGERVSLGRQDRVVNSVPMRPPDASTRAASRQPGCRAR